MAKQSIPVTIDPAKREAILDCAIRIFARAGFRNTDVQVVADEAGVGKGTVYRYFGNKQQLFAATADAGLKKLEIHVFKAIEGVDSSEDLIRRGSLAYAEFFQQNPELVEILIQERAEFRDSVPATHLVYREKNREMFEQLLQRGIEAGELRPIDASQTIDAFANFLYGTVVCGCIAGSAGQLRRMAEHAVEIFLRGVLADPSSNDKQD